MEEESNVFPACIENAQAGELILKAGFCELAGKQYPADYGTLIVPENRTDEHSRLIQLPVVRIRSTSANPVEPIFLLRGGPGNSNINITWFKHDWLLENHDIVKVGYRGVDGSVQLDCDDCADASACGENPLSGEGLRQEGKILSACFKQLMDKGIDLSGYNVAEVMEDIDAARKAFGYNQVNLFGHSWGARLAYYYGLRFPERVHRCIMVGMCPPGTFVWEPDKVDEQLTYLNELWKQNQECVARTPDLVLTMRSVLKTLPLVYKDFRIDKDKVRVMSFYYLESSVEAAVQVFDAYVAAATGDYRGLAFLSCDYDEKMAGYGVEGIAKLMGLDLDPDRDYETELDPPDSIIGSPWAKLQWAPYKYWDRELFGGELPIKPAAEMYRHFQYTDVESLIVSGSVDMATPVYKAIMLLPYLRRGLHVTLSERGHMDLVTDYSDAFRRLMEGFYLEGTVDDSGFEYEPVSFKPKITFQELFDARKSKGRGKGL